MDIPFSAAAVGSLKSGRELGTPCPAKWQNFSEIK
jgi:hypothetical protein